MRRTSVPYPMGELEKMDYMCCLGATVAKWAKGAPLTIRFDREWIVEQAGKEGRGDDLLAALRRVGEVVR